MRGRTLERICRKDGAQSGDRVAALLRLRRLQRALPRYKGGECQVRVLQGSPSRPRALCRAKNFRACPEVDHHHGLLKVRPIQEGESGRQRLKESQGREPPPQRQNCWQAKDDERRQARLRPHSKMMQAAAFQKGEDETTPGRVQPDRRWFGTSRSLAAISRRRQTDQ